MTILVQGRRNMQQVHPPQIVSSSRRIWFDRRNLCILCVGMLVLWSVDGWALSGGPEFRVNTTTAGTQHMDEKSPAAVGMNANGNWVIGWMTDEDRNIRARVFGPTGAAITGEVSATIGNNAGSVSADIDGAGNFVVNWTALDGSGAGVFARRFDAAGTPQAAEYRVNMDSILQEQRYSSVRFDGSGNYFVAFGGRNIAGGVDSEEVAYRKYRFSDQALLLGGSQIVNTTVNGGIQWMVSLDVLPTGRFVVGFADRTAPENVLARPYDAAGAPVVAEAVANTGTTNIPSWYCPDVAMDSSGNYIVVWHTNDTGGDGSGYGIFSRRYNAAGAAIDGAPVQVNTITAGDQTKPRVEMDSSGNYTIVWEGPDASGTGIYARQYNNAGVPLAVESLINQTTTGTQDKPGLALNDVLRAWPMTFPSKETGSATPAEMGSSLSPHKRDLATPIVGRSSITPRWLAMPRPKGCKVPLPSTINTEGSAILSINIS